MLCAQQLWLLTDFAVCGGWIIAIGSNLDEFIKENENFLKRGCTWSAVFQFIFKLAISSNYSLEKLPGLVFTVIATVLISTMLQLIFGLPFEDVKLGLLIGCFHSIIIGPSLWKVATVDRAKVAISRSALLTPIVASSICFIWPTLFNVLDWNNKWKIYPRTSIISFLAFHLWCSGVLLAFTRTSHVHED